MRIPQSWFTIVMLLVCTGLPGEEFGNWEWEKAPFSAADYAEKKECIDAFNGHYAPFEVTYAAEMKAIQDEIKRLLEVSDPISKELQEVEKSLEAAKAKWDKEAPALQRELKDLQKEEKRLAARLKQLERRLGQINDLLSGVLKPARRADLMREKARVEADIAELSSKLAEITGRIAQITAALEAMQAEINKWKQSQDSLKKQLKVVEERLRALAAVQAKMIASHEEMKKSWDTQIKPCQNKE